MYLFINVLPETGSQSLKHMHTHNRLTALCLEQPGWACTRKVKPIWILLKQETVSGSGISWAIYKSAPRSRHTHNHASTPPLNFLQDGCPSCRPTNSVKAPKAVSTVGNKHWSKSHWSGKFVVVCMYALWCVCSVLCVCPRDLCRRPCRHGWRTSVGSSLHPAVHSTFDSSLQSWSSTLNR